MYFLIAGDVTEQFRESGIPATVSRGSSHKTVETGLHDTHSSLDIRSIFQGQITTLSVAI